jgi:hypothetical protein
MRAVARGKTVEQEAAYNVDHERGRRAVDRRLPARAQELEPVADERLGLLASERVDVDLEEESEERPPLRRGDPARGGVGLHALGQGTP